MTKEECRSRLMAGEALDSILRFRPGQDCMIFKADALGLGDEIVYVPDIELNGIPVDKDLSGDADGILDVLGYCYTGNDFLELCGGNTEHAEELFNFVDWQHPSSGVVDLELEWSDEEHDNEE